MEFVDVGRACVLSSAEVMPEQQQQFVAGRPVAVRYYLDKCFSYSCSWDREATCTMTTNGQARVFTSTFRWVDPSGPETVCTEDCYRLTAKCETDTLSEGTYQIHLGRGVVVDLTVPSLLDSSPCQTIGEVP